MDMCEGIKNEEEIPITMLKYDEKSKKCLITKDFIDNTRIELNDNKLKNTDSIYESLPMNAHCNKYDIEKWQDWFCISNYYLNNNFSQGEKQQEDVNTNAVSVCYEPCNENDTLISKPGDSSKCIIKSSYLNGKYDKYTIFDPFSIICLLGSTKETIKGGVNKSNDYFKGSYLFKLNEIKNREDNSKWDDNFELVKDKKNTEINIIEDIIENSSIFIEIIESDIRASVIKYKKYITEINNEIVAGDDIDNDDRIKQRIVQDISLFNNLLKEYDNNYINYLKKISKYPGNNGIEYSLEVAKYQKGKDKLSLFEINNEHMNDEKNKKYIEFAFNYCCFLCFSNKSDFHNKIKDFTLSTNGTGIDNHENSNLSIADDPSIDPSSQLRRRGTSTDLFKDPLLSDEKVIQIIRLKQVNEKINIENIILFEDYKSIFANIKNYTIIFYISFLLLIILFCFILFADYYKLIFKITTIMNVIYIYTNELLFILMYYIAHIQVLFFKTIIHVYKYIFKIFMWILGVSVIIAIILILFGEAERANGIFNFIISIIKSIFGIILKIIISFYNFLSLSIPFFILSIYTYIIIINQDFNNIMYSDIFTGQEIINLNLLINKYDYYINNLEIYKNNLEIYITI
jgi:hypothetical protein